MKKILHISFVVVLITFLGCAGSTDTAPKKQEAESTKAENPFEKNGLKLIPVKDSPEFLDAKVSLNSPTASAQLPEGNIDFSFGVENYVLGNQTPDADAKRCANSAKGQHIHLILNNQPYSAHYVNEFSKEIGKGYYVALAFLSRSYHESIKTKDAYALWDFTVGDLREQPQIDLTGPNIFYSRPKGKYIGPENTERVMLDFYLTNTSISEDGNKVIAEINGTEFTLTEWCPYFIEGLPMGQNTIKLTLVNKDGQKIGTQFNGVTRKIELYKDEPLVPNP